MIAKELLMRESITPLGLRLLSILHDWERSDANLRQLTNEMKFRKYYKYVNEKQIQTALDSLVEQGYVNIVEYKGGIKHYILDIYFSH